MTRVRLHDIEFELFISEQDVNAAVDRLAGELRKKYDGKRPLFVGVLNGAFFFAAELMKRLDIECEITFVKVASYHGTSSTGKVSDLIGLNERITDRHVVVLEDIVDTGNTVRHILDALKDHIRPVWSIATLLSNRMHTSSRTSKLNIVAQAFPTLCGGSGWTMMPWKESARHYQINPERKMNKLNIVLFGPPGAGKGTQSAFLIKKYNLAHLSTGDLLRAEIKAESTLGLKAKELMDVGELVPDEVVIGMIKNAIEEHVEADGFIFDGFPRTKAQAEALDEMLEFRQDRSLPCCIGLRKKNL